MIHVGDLNGNSSSNTSEHLDQNFWVVIVNLPTFSTCTDCWQQRTCGLKTQSHGDKPVRWLLKCQSVTQYLFSVVFRLGRAHSLPLNKGKRNALCNGLLWEPLLDQILHRSVSPWLFHLPPAVAQQLLSSIRDQKPYWCNSSVLSWENCATSWNYSWERYFS